MGEGTSGLGSARWAAILLAALLLGGCGLHNPIAFVEDLPPKGDPTTGYPRIVAPADHDDMENPVLTEAERIEMEQRLNTMPKDREAAVRRRIETRR